MKLKYGLVCAVVLYAQAFALMRDPTQPPGMAYAVQTKADAIHLQGIFYRNGHSRALIAGEYKKVGDLVEGAKIIAIYKHGVLLQGDGGDVEVSMAYPTIRQPATKDGHVDQ